VLVGTATNANWPSSDPVFAQESKKTTWHSTPVPSGAVPQWIVDQANKDWRWAVKPIASPANDWELIVRMEVETSWIGDSIIGVALKDSGNADIMRILGFNPELDSYLAYQDSVFSTGDATISSNTALRNPLVGATGTIWWRVAHDTTANKLMAWFSTTGQTWSKVFEWTGYTGNFDRIGFGSYSFYQSPTEYGILPGLLCTYWSDNF